MIRALVDDDLGAAQALLKEASGLNLYLLGNLATLGVAHEVSRFWGDFAGAELRGIANLYMTGWSVYGRAEADWAGLAGLIDTHPTTAQRLQDNPGGIPSILPFLRAYEAVWLREEELMELDAADFRPQAAESPVEVRRATWDDFAALVEFFHDAGDMSRTPAAVERPLRDRRIWVALVQGEMAAAALTNAETAHAAMVGGVYTIPARRGQGLSQAVCSALCTELLAEGKRPHLYWDNPAAGAVYRKLGFHPVGVWRSVRLARRPG